MNRLEEIKDQRILLATLNWGMGHVSRCIPIVHKLIKKNNTVIFAGNLDQIHIIKQYFPTIECVVHQGYPFAFKGKGNFASDIFWSLPHLFHSLRKEKKLTAELVYDFHIDLVISDHRYGFVSSKVPSVFITHQLNLPLRKYQRPVQYWHKKLIEEFAEIWIPDEENKPLAGELSKNTGWKNVHYLGWLSRFSIYKELPSRDLNLVVIASGPEIYAKQFMQEKLDQYRFDEKCVFIADKKIASHFNDERIVASENWPTCDQIILRAKKIITRSGYSSLMDILYLKVNSEVFPTPGQAEQEYLFRSWKGFRNKK